MCDIYEEINVLLKNDNSNTGKAIKLLSKQVDRRLTAQEKELKKIHEDLMSELKEFKDRLEIFALLAKYKKIFWILAAVLAFITANGLLETIKLFLKV